GGEAQLQIDEKPGAIVHAAVRQALSTPPANRHGIDHSCSPYFAQVAGLDDALLTMNCRLAPVGPVGASDSFLEIRWAAAGVTLPDGTKGPFSAQFRHAGASKMTVLGPDGKKREVEVMAVVAPKWHLMRLAWGAGPYTLKSSARTGNGVAGSLMAYGNLRLRP